MHCPESPPMLHCRQRQSDQSRPDHDDSYRPGAKERRLFAMLLVEQLENLRDRESE
jgi:hypothetical protein